MVRLFTFFFFLLLGQLVVAQETVAVEEKTEETKPHPAMLDPDKAVEEAPAEFDAKFTTTKGEFVLRVNREWSPNGADRFYNLVKIGYFKDIAFFRAIEGFMVQFGIHGDPKVNEVWSEATFKDDPVKEGISNGQAFISFAKSGRPNSRSVQFFISLEDNARLDSYGFTPFGKVVEGFEIVKKINTEYGENPDYFQGAFQERGNEFALKEMPNLDLIKSVELVDPDKDDKEKESAEKRQ